MVAPLVHPVAFGLVLEIDDGLGVLGVVLFPTAWQVIANVGGSSGPLIDARHPGAVWRIGAQPSNPQAQRIAIVSGGSWWSVGVFIPAASFR